MAKPVHVLHRGAEVEEIVNIAAIAVVDAQETAARLERQTGTQAAPHEEATLQPV